MMSQDLLHELESLESLPRDVALTAKRMRQHLERSIASEYSGMATWNVLIHVMVNEGCGQADLARQIGIAKSTLTRHLDRMEAQGLIERTQDAEDLRRTLITSTTSGREVQAKFRQRATELGERMLAGISDDDREALRRALARIRSNIEQEERD